MRYPPKTRIQYPTADYTRLWAVLDRIGIKYTKIADIYPERQDKRTNYTIPALLNDFNAGIMLKSDLPHGKLLNNKSKEVIKRILEKCKEKNIKILEISRKLDKFTMEIMIKRWLNDLKKGE